MLLVRGRGADRLWGSSGAARAGAVPPDGSLLRQPLPYLSLFFKQHRSRYYELLDAVRCAAMVTGRRGSRSSWKASKAPLPPP